MNISGSLIESRFHEEVNQITSLPSKFLNSNNRPLFLGRLIFAGILNQRD